MKTHTNQFKINVKQMGRQIDSIITYGQTTLHDELYAVTPLFETNILKSVMKQLDVESSVDIPLGTIINYQLGLKVEDNYEYLDYGNYVVYQSEKQEDTNTYKITCYDKMLYAMKGYEDLEITYPITIKNYLSAIANKIGLTLMDTNFYNYNLQIPAELYLGLDYTYRDVLDEIAQATGSIICINSNDQLEVRYLNITGDTIDEEYLKDVNVTFKEKYGPINSIVLSRAGESDNVYIQDAQSIAQNGLCEIKIVDNQIMNGNNRSDYLQGLLDALGGFEYYINDFSSTGILYYDVFDGYNVTIDEQTYNCVMLNDEINITSGIEELTHTDMPEQSETDYSKADKTDRRINQTYIIVDKQNQTIESVVSNVTTQNNKISQISQTVDEINQKISDIADITVTAESNYAFVELNRINESEPILIRVHPIGTNISKLYPRTNLYPSSSLFMTIRKIRFTRTYTEEGETHTENIDYEMPDDLLYYDSENYDEFHLDYESQTCEIIKRCKYNADGTVSLLTTPITTTYDYPTITLGAGNYVVSILTYNAGYIKATLMSENIYTTQFYTKSETDSRINQKADEIELGVSRTLSNYSTTNQMNSAINVKADEITSNVSNTYATKSNLEGNYYTKSETNTQISQTAESITSEVSETYETKTHSTDTYATKTTTNNLSSRIGQTAKSITLSVNNQDTKSGITITTTKENGTTATATGTIQMTGLVSFTNLSTSGQTTINGGNITTGTIKAVTLQSTNYSSGSAGTRIKLSDGTIDSKNFKIDSSGNVTISGKVTASSGTIGGFTLGSTKLYNNKSTLTASSNGVYIGTDGISLGTGSTFKVTNSGSLTATNATISGNITATSGTIGGCTISNGTLIVDNANINSINGNKISDGSISGGKIGSGTIVGGNIANGTITSAKIQSISADKITAGTIHGCDLAGGYLNYDYVDVMRSLQLGPSSTHEYPRCDVFINGYTGQDYQLIVQHEGQYWRRLTFHRGILVNVESEW